MVSAPVDLHNATIQVRLKEQGKQGTWMYLGDMFPGLGRLNNQPHGNVYNEMAVIVRSL